MKTVLVVLTFLLAVSEASARAVNCRVDEYVEGGQRIVVPVTVVKTGSQTTEKKVHFAGRTISAVWDPNGQSWFKMNFGKVVSIMYDFHPDNFEGPINILYDGNLRFQCWAQ